MKIVVITHPSSLNSTSMPRFAGAIVDGMRSRGHSVKCSTSANWLNRFNFPSTTVKKWVGYIDQFVIYPPLLAKFVAKSSRDTLFVVADQALGMLVPRVAHRPHVIHCHDFLALRSALGEIPQNPTSWSGRQYQSLILNGFRKGKNFVSVSNRSREDLHRFLKDFPQTSEVVHNGLNGPFRQIYKSEAEALLQDQLTENERNGFILHVGGNQWYKNRRGVVSIYSEYCKLVHNPTPLWMIGASPSEALRDAAAKVPENGRLRFFVGLSNEQVVAAYNLADLFLFPSLEEGFGWPIAEAMACGARVITTNDAPMSEVGGDAATYIPRQNNDVDSWAKFSAQTIVRMQSYPVSIKNAQIDAGLAQSKRFSQKQALDKYEIIYERILRSNGSKV